MGTLQVGGTTLGVKNTSTNKIDLSNVGEVGSITGGNFGTITQRSASSSSPTFTRSSGVTISSSDLTNLYGGNNFAPNGTTNSTHAWVAWDYGSGNARKLTQMQWYQVDGSSNSTGIFLEGSNVDSPNASSGHSDWTLLESFGVISNAKFYSYQSPVTGATLKYRHYRIRYAFSSGNYGRMYGFVLEDTDSTFDARTALNAVGDAPIFACRAAAHVEYATDYSSQNVTKFLNVSSVTMQTDVGDRYTVNFTTPLPDAKYVAVVGSGRDWNTQKQMSVLVQSPDMTRTSSACQFGNVYNNTNSEKMRTFNAAFFS